MLVLTVDPSSLHTSARTKHGILHTDHVLRAQVRLIAPVEKATGPEEHPGVPRIVQGHSRPCRHRAKKLRRGVGRDLKNHFRRSTVAAYIDSPCPRRPWSSRTGSHGEAVEFPPPVPDAAGARIDRPSCVDRIGPEIQVSVERNWIAHETSVGV